LDAEVLDKSITAAVEAAVDMAATY
jgi:hypothetical protein